MQLAFLTFKCYYSIDMLSPFYKKTTLAEREVTTMRNKTKPAVMIPAKADKEKLMGKNHG